MCVRKMHVFTLATLAVLITSMMVPMMSQGCDAIVYNRSVEETVIVGEEFSFKTTFSNVGSGNKLNSSNVPEWVVYSGTSTSQTISGIVPEAGVYEFTISTGVSSKNTKVTYKITAVNPPHSESVTFDANGGTGAPDRLTSDTSDVQDTVFQIPDAVPVRSGYEFIGWSVSSTSVTADYQIGGSVTVAHNQDITLYAVWKLIAPSIGSIPDTVGKVGTSWTCTPTVSGLDAVLSVSGASWLSVANGKIVGTPSTAGTYNVNVTVSNNGGSDTESFTIVIYSVLTFNSVPGNGIVFFVS